MLTSLWITSSKVPSVSMTNVERFTGDTNLRRTSNRSAPTDWMPSTINKHPRSAHRFLDDRVERDPLAPQLELAGVEPCDIEQVVDEPRDVMDLALDDAADPRGDRRVRIVLEHLDGRLQRL